MERARARTQAGAHLAWEGTAGRYTVYAFSLSELGAAGLGGRTSAFTALLDPSLSPFLENFGVDICYDALLNLVP